MVGDTPTGVLCPFLLGEHAMSNLPDPDLTRTGRLWLAAAALRGILSGATRAAITWMLEQYLH
jgi:hypothetical protein